MLFWEDRIKSEEHIDPFLFRQMLKRGNLADKAELTSVSDA
jgi:hypothetical protein